MNARGKPISAIKVLSGHGKDSKLHIKDQAIFYDNMMLEMNLRPARTLLEFCSSFKECLDGTVEILRERGDYYLAAISSLNFPRDQIEDVEAKIFGCEPEFCIYNKNEAGQILRVPPPILAEDNPFRSCGGHIHIGHTVANWQLGGKPAEVIRIMDQLVGIVSTFIDTDSASSARRKIYGGAGSHRITDYGVEYRTPSNYWLRSPHLTKIVYGLTRQAIELAITNPTLIDSVIDESTVQKVINTSNEKEALAIYKTYSQHLTPELQGHIDTAFSFPIDELPISETWAGVRVLAA